MGRSLGIQCITCPRVIRWKLPWCVICGPKTGRRDYGKIRDGQTGREARQAVTRRDWTRLNRPGAY